MRAARKSRDLIITAEQKLPMSTTGKAIINQPGQNSFACRLVAVGKILADGTLPVAKGLHSLFDETIVCAFVAGGASSALLLNVYLRRKRKTVRSRQGREWFSRTQEFDRIFYRGPTFLSCERWATGGLVFLPSKRRLQVFEIRSISARIGTCLVNFCQQILLSLGKARC